MAYHYNRRSFTNSAAGKVTLVGSGMIIGGAIGGYFGYNAGWNACVEEIDRQANAYFGKPDKKNDDDKKK